MTLDSFFFNCAYFFELSTVSPDIKSRSTRCTVALLLHQPLDSKKAKCILNLMHIIQEYFMHIEADIYIWIYIYMDHTHTMEIFLPFIQIKTCNRHFSASDFSTSEHTLKIIPIIVILLHNKLSLNSVACDDISSPFL